MRSWCSVVVVRTSCQTGYQNVSSEGSEVSRLEQCLAQEPSDSFIFNQCVHVFKDTFSPFSSCCFWCVEEESSLCSSCNIFHSAAHQCHYMLLSLVNIFHIGYINPAHFSPNRFICEFWCLFTFCPYLMNVTESIWKCVTMLVKRIAVGKIPLHVNIPARKAALVWNYFSRRNNFGLNGSRLPFLSRLVIFDQINTEVLFRRMN